MLLPSPQCVGQEFVRQYYTMLNEAPEYMHRFYSHDSSLIHGGIERMNENQVVHGQSNIHKKIMSLNFRDCHARIRQVDSLSTVDNAVVVQVSGELSNNGQLMRKFMQTFILVPQSPKKYYVHNDIFRYQDEVFVEDSYAHISGMVQQYNPLKVQEDMKNSTSENNVHGHQLYQQQQQLMQQSTTLHHVGQQLPVQPVFQSCQQLELLMSAASASLPQLPQQSKNVASDEKNDGTVVVVVAEVVAVDGSNHDSNVEFPKLGAPSDLTNQTSKNVSSSSAESPSLAAATTTTPSISTTTTTTTLTTTPTSTTMPSILMNNAQSDIKTSVTYYTPTNAQANLAINKLTNSKINVTTITAAAAATTTTTTATTTTTKDETSNRRNQLSWAELTASKRNDECDSVESLHNFKQQSTTTTTTANNNLTTTTTTTTSTTTTTTNSVHNNVNKPDDITLNKSTIPTTTSATTIHSTIATTTAATNGQPASTQTQATTATATTSTGQQTSYRSSGYDQLFVGNLPNDITKQQLKTFFSKFGNVVEVRISKKTTHNKDVPNFGFVKFESVEIAEKVLQSKPLHLENGHRLNVEEKRSDQMRSNANKMSTNQSRYASSSPTGSGWWGSHKSGYSRGNQNKGYGGASNKYNKPSS